MDRDPTRFQDNPLVILRNLAPAQRKRRELVKRALREARQGNRSLGIAIGLFPNPVSDEQQSNEA